MAESMPQWKGLFDWSMQYQDGTRPVDFTSVDADPEKIKWLEMAMKNYMVDFTKRMTTISEGLTRSTGDDASEADVKHAESLLEELTEIVESIDFARDLRSIGGLPVLKALLRGPRAGLRWRAADVIATCCQNNLPVQEWFLEEDVLPTAVNLLRDSDATVRAKGLLATSCLTRTCTPALESFCEELHALPVLLPLIEDDDARVARKALQLCWYICSSAPQLMGDIAETRGFVEGLAASLVADDQQVQSAALLLLAKLADSPKSLQLVQNHERLRQAYGVCRGLVLRRYESENDVYAEEKVLVDTLDDAGMSPVGGASGV